MGTYKIEVLSNNFPYEEITELLHASYKMHADENRQFLAAKQTVEQTKKRLENAICMLAYDGEGLVGMISAKIYHKENDKTRRWYEDDSYAVLEQMAIRPDYQKSNLLSMMLAKGIRMNEIRNLDSVIMDTSAKATELVSHYQRLGGKIVDLVSWESTNYYSYVFRKPMKGKVYSDRYCKWKYFWSAMRCKIRYTEDGKKRF